MLSLSVIKEHVGQVQTEYPVGSVNVKGISSDGSHILAATFLPSAASCAPISLTQHMENPTQPSETTVINLPSKPSLLLLLNHTGGKKTFKYTHSKDASGFTGLMWNSDSL